MEELEGRTLMSTYFVTNAGDSAQPGSGSLRRAIMDANSSAGPNVIKFNLVTTPGQTAPPEIQPFAVLPSFNKAITIDGTTEPKWGQIQLDGGFAGDVAGLTLAHASCHVRGLILTNWNQALDVTANNNEIDHNLIGLDTFGTAAANQDGVYIDSVSGNMVHDNMISGNTVGVDVEGSGANQNTINNNKIGTDAGGTAAVPNVLGVNIQGGAKNKILQNTISGNTSDGVRLAFTTTQNTVEDNNIGTDAGATMALPNGTGVELQQGPSANLIQSNVISGNAEEGIVLLGANGNQFIGNFIGVDKTFLHKLPNKLGVSIIAQSSGNLLQNNVILFNTQYGVRMIENGTSNNILKGNSIAYSDEGVFVGDQASGNTIGGTDPGAGNDIYFNNGAGVTVGGGDTDTSAGNAILGNAIYGNGALGIDLGGDGPTPNQPSNPADGPNGLQNYPVLSGAVHKNGGVTISENLHSAPNNTYRLEFFVALGGQGMIYLGFVDATTDGNGDVSFSHNFVTAFTKADPGLVSEVTATATDKLRQNTSEFSNPVAVMAVKKRSHGARGFSAAGMGPARQSAEIVLTPETAQPQAKYRPGLAGRKTAGLTDAGLGFGQEQ